ncbi:MAG: HisA/HisF-related TIM barrel protein, partial [Gammaproteobacteria bacterium]|nr:HisA/HisF-related TIM barrel protein [Gammaproteobacteria bacterium]
VHTAKQAKKIIALGVEKVAISSAALEQPELITRIADEIGSQSVVVVLDIKKKRFSKNYEVWTHNATRNTKRNIFDVITEIEVMGAGEVVINSIDNDGQMKGYDIKLVFELRKIVNIPLTILGGAGSLDDMREAVSTCGLIGMSAGSLFIFKGPYRAVLISYPDEQQKNDIVFSALLSR